jgi:hypothetical protein
MQRRVRQYGLKLQSAHYYTHYTKGARITRALRFPEIFTEDLFVVVFCKN